VVWEVGGVGSVAEEAADGKSAARFWDGGDCWVVGTLPSLGETLPSDVADVDTGFIFLKKFRTAFLITVLKPKLQKEIALEPNVNKKEDKNARDSKSSSLD